jgi:hypothetical protein
MSLLGINVPHLYYSNVNSPPPPKRQNFLELLLPWLRHILSKESKGKMKWPPTEVAAFHVTNTES